MKLDNFDDLISQINMFQRQWGIKKKVDIDKVNQAVYILGNDKQSLSTVYLDYTQCVAQGYDFDSEQLYERGIVNE